MSWNNKVVWSEGMFLRPQHFQQQDRCFEQAVRHVMLNRRAFAWGVEQLTIDAASLESGRLAVPRCRGVLPDGTPFSVPDEQDPPAPLAVASQSANAVVYLAAPLEREALVAAEYSGGAEALPRWEMHDIDVFDTAQTSLGSKAAIRVGRMKMSLMLQGEPLQGHHCIPIVRIREIASGNRIILDDQFIPSCIDHRASVQLTSFLEWMGGRLNQRIKEIADHVSTSGRSRVAEMADFMFLQVLNRLAPLVMHLARDTGRHPDELFEFFLQVAGELATFTLDSRQAETFPAYRHENLAESFAPVERSIRRSLDWLPERRAVAIPIEYVDYGIHRSFIRDHALLDGAAFLLEISADVEPETLVRTFRAQSKLGPQDLIADLVKQQMPGIPVRFRPNVPRQIPVHTGASYFEIDKGHELWAAVAQTGVLCIFAPKLANLAMALWAIKG